MIFIERFIRLPDLLTRWDCPLEYVCSLTHDYTPRALRCYKIHSIRKSGGCFAERQMPFIARHEFDRVELPPYPGSERTRIKEPLYKREDVVFDLDEIERVEGKPRAETAKHDADIEKTEKDAPAGADALKSYYAGNGSFSDLVNMIADRRPLSEIAKFMHENGCSYGDIGKAFNGGQKEKTPGTLRTDGSRILKGEKDKK